MFSEKLDLRIEIARFQAKESKKDRERGGRNGENVYDAALF